MEKLLIALLLIPAFSFTQDIESVFTGITLDSLTPQQTKEYAFRHSMHKVIENADTITYAYNFTGYQAIPRLLCIFQSGTQSVIRAVLLESPTGMLTIDKRAFTPGHYKGFVFTGEELDGNLGFSVEVDSKIKKSLGDYVIYWDKTNFTYKYIGLD